MAVIAPAVLSEAGRRWQGKERPREPCSVPVYQGNDISQVIQKLGARYFSRQDLEIWFVLYAFRISVQTSHTAVVSSHGGGLLLWELLTAHCPAHVGSGCRAERVVLQDRPRSGHLITAQPAQQWFLHTCGHTAPEGSFSNAGTWEVGHKALEQWDLRSHPLGVAS